MPITCPAVFGLGGIGGLVATMLSDLNMRVVAIDKVAPTALPANHNIEFRVTDVTDAAALAHTLIGCDAAIACLPYSLILPVARAAHAAGIHYFDPTEDVETTEVIRELSQTAAGVMIPQNGLAPGFIGILAAHLASQFDVGSLRHIKLRVGALPQHPIGQLGYAGNWSLEGLVHEYTATCDVIANRRRQKEAALEDVEVLRLNGIEYEAFTTSGGLGTMAETYEGQVDILNYKTIRYPGHLDGMRLLIEELRFKERPQQLVQCLADALPPDDQDRVLIHASVQGNLEGRLQSRELVADYRPIDIGGQMRTAIAWTTAASIVAVIELVSRGILPQQGFVKQEMINLESFLRTMTGQLYALHNAALRTLI
jgi:saccharopine dehydrogenase (NAD+, L-lysine-forming)